MAKKIIALVSEPVSGDALKNAVGRLRGRRGAGGGPALESRHRWLLDDPDPAIERADAVQEETVERMDEQGVDAAGDTGEADPLLAIQDALQTFDADEIVLFIHPGEERNWLEEGLVEDARERFEPPVRHLEIEPA